MNITFENIEQFNIPLNECVTNWIFTDDNGELPPIEHQDQITALNKEASNFLWKYEADLHIEPLKYYKNIRTFDGDFSDNKLIKKYLYNLGIPFDQKVFISFQPDWGYILTWKMVIKYSNKLFFAHDVSVMDFSHSWYLEFNHNDVFTFAKDYIYDYELEMRTEQEKLKIILEEIEKRKITNSNNLKIDKKI